MHRRGGGLRIVLLLAVAVGITAGSGAAAAVLTAEEMGAIRGGCAQLYCKQIICGHSVDCSQTPAGFCTPGVTCRDVETKIQQQTVETCDSPLSNGHPCTRGADTPCGTLWDCRCVPSGYTQLWNCTTTNQQSAGIYHPC